jgi:hypothetical protein
MKILVNLSLYILPFGSEALKALHEYTVVTLKTLPQEE